MAKNRRRNRRRLQQPLLRAGKRFRPLQYTLSGKPILYRTIGQYDPEPRGVRFIKPVLIDPPMAWSRYPHETPSEIIGRADDTFHFTTSMREPMEWHFLDCGREETESDRTIDRIMSQATQRASQRMAAMDEETLQQLMERYGITVDDLLAASDWELIYGRNEYGTRTIIGITNASPIAIEHRPRHSETFHFTTSTRESDEPQVTPTTIQSILDDMRGMEVSYPTRDGRMITRRIRSWSELNESAPSETGMQNPTPALDAVLADNEQRLRAVRALGGDEETVLRLNRDILNDMRKKTPHYGNSLYSDIIQSWVEALHALIDYRKEIKSKFIPCPCGHRQPLDAASDDYHLGLAFCDECGAGYSLEFDGDTYKGHKAFAGS